MARSVSITVHPSDFSGEYLTVSDAMKQVLDMIGALEGMEAENANDRQIVWRLTDAHTNSPPLTVKAEAFSRDPQVSVTIEAERVTTLYSVALSSVLSGSKPDWLESGPGKLLRQALQRNLDGVGHTDVVIGSDEPIIIVPSNARVGLSALEKADTSRDELQRTEYGSIECKVVGLTTYYSAPALEVIEKVSGQKCVCVLTSKLAEELGHDHQWSEAWEGRSLLVGGKLTYDGYGKLKRVNAVFHEPVETFDVPIADLASLELKDVRSVKSRLDDFWGDRFA